MTIRRFQKEYRFLSNFWPAPVKLLPSFFKFCQYEERYTTVEHAYQAAKLVGEKQRAIVSQLPKPGDAKRIMAAIPKDWGWDFRPSRLEIMEALLRQKFEPKSELARRLLETEYEELIDGNDLGDTFWGVDLGNGRGENNLGRLLMAIRYELRGKEDKKMRG
jgi:ribA/ribD-fused uncharacterized protein